MPAAIFPVAGLVRLSLCLCVLAAPGLPALAQPAQQNLCTPEEKVVLACSTGKKLLSVCASATLSRHAGYLQYRFGLPDAVEMRLPETLSAPGKQVSFGDSEYYLDGADYYGSWLRFRKGNLSYTVYDFARDSNFHPYERRKPRLTRYGGVMVEKMQPYDEKEGDYPPNVRLSHVRCQSPLQGVINKKWLNRQGKPALLYEVAGHPSRVSLGDGLEPVHGDLPVRAEDLK